MTDMKMEAEEDVFVDSPAESPITSPVSMDVYSCSKCEEKMKQPKILHCLHVFCLDCLEKKVSEEKEEGTQPAVVQCPKCKQETPIPEKGLSELLSDYVRIDLMEMAAIQEKQIICTSCKAKEKAVARCSDCANFLCPNCVTAHQFMRCFENHRVVKFEDMKDGDKAAFHAPIFCTSHPAENLKSYCITCVLAICSECVPSHSGRGHQVQHIADLEEQERNALKTLIAEGKGKVDSCETASGELQNSLGDLQTQRDNAKDLVNETFQSYKAILEKIKDDTIEELEASQSAQELAIMELCHNIEKTVDKLDDGCSLTEHILNNGSTLHILLLKNLISSQLLSLVNNTPNPEFNISLEFKTDAKAFETVVRKHFGSFSKPEKVTDRPPSSLHSSFENEGFNLQTRMLSPEALPMPPSSRAEFLSQMSMSPGISHGNRHFDLSYPGMVGPGTIGMPPPGMTAIGGCRPTAIEGRSMSRDSHSPAMSDSGISVDAASTNSSSSVPFVNIAALAKLGTVAYSSQGMTGCGSVSDPISASANSQLTLNGQIVPGLNMNNISGMPPVGSRGPTPVSESLTAITRSGSGTPNLEALVGLLNQNTSSTIGNFSDLPTGWNSSSSPNIGMFGTGSTTRMGAYGDSSSTTNLGNITPTFPTVSGGLSGSDSSVNTVGTGNLNPVSPFPPPVRRSNKMSAMQIRCKFGQLGPGKGQFNSPHGFCLGVDDTITVADTNNHRIQVFEKTGEFKYQFGIPGREEGQLWYPRKVMVLKTSGKYVVCDRGNERSRMQIFSKNGHFIRKVAIRYIDIVAGIAITRKGNIVAVDSVSPTVFCISENGDLIKWYDCSDYMREPSDIAVSGDEYFVCDFKGHCVVVFNEEGQFQRRIGCENITNYPNGIDISDAGDVLVGDSHGNRFHVAVFQRDGSLIGEFECPYVKVSRCCGLKITEEGYIVTLAKNNHHVLVLNTLYIL